MENQGQNIRSWDDLIFENRNKAYGAYALRHAYSNELIKGLLMSIGVAVVLLIVAGFTNTNSIVEKVVDVTKQITIGPPPNIKTESIVPAQQKEQNQKVNRDLPPVAVTTPEIVEPSPGPVQTSTGTEGTSDGVATSNAGISETGVDAGSGFGTGEVKTNEPFTHVEVMPEYASGYKGMIKVLTNNMRYPASARRMGKEGTVFVEFVVNDEGEVQDVKVLRGFDKDCDSEAVRIVSKLTEWTPGMQNKIKVNVKLVLPIKFKLEQ